MRGARPEHAFAFELGRPDEVNYGQWGTLDEVERVLATLVAAEPKRLDGKQRDFRALRVGDSGLRGLQAELVFGAYLAKHGVGFDFGAPGTPEPDLVLRNLELGVELTTRKADASWELRKHLALAMREVRPRVHLALEFSAAPFAIRSRSGLRSPNEVLAAIAEGETTVHSVIRPARPQHPAVTLTITISPRGRSGLWPDVRITHSDTLLRPLMSDVEDALVVAMEDKRKRKQAQTMPTVLVIDISRISGAWLRPTRSWGQGLVQLIEPEHHFAGLAVMICSGWSTDFRFWARVDTPPNQRSLPPPA